MSEIRYIASDLDGTIVDAAGIINAKVIKFIGQLIEEKKIDKFIIASGRHFRDIIPFLNQIDYKDNVIVICCDGQYIYDAYGKLLFNFSCYLDGELASEIIESRRIKGITVVTPQKDYIMVSSFYRILWYRLKKLINKKGMKPIISSRRIKKIQNIEKLCVYGLDDSIKNSIGGNYFEHTLKTGIKEYTPVNKMLAINMLDETSLIEMSKTVYFGDDDNDIECFSSNMKCIAAPNASKNITQLTSEVVKNKIDGVFDWLVEHFSN